MTNHTMYVIYCSTRIKNKMFYENANEVCDMMKKDARNLYYNTCKYFYNNSKY